MSRFTYNPATPDRRADYISQKYAAISSAIQSVGNAAVGAVGQYQKQQTDRQRMGALYESIAAEDPETAQDLEKFGKSSYGAQQGMLGAALTRYQARMQEGQDASQMQRGLDMYRQKLDMQQAAQAFDPQRDIVGTEVGGQQLYFDRRDGSAVQVPESDEVRPIPGTKYQGVFRGGRLIQSLPTNEPALPQQVDWPDGSVTLKQGDMTRTFVPDGRGGVTAQPAGRSAATQQPKIIKGPDGTPGTVQIDPATGQPVFVPLQGAGGAAAGGGPMSRIRQAMGQ